MRLCRSFFMVGWRCCSCTALSGRLVRAGNLLWFRPLHKEFRMRESRKQSETLCGMVQMPKGFFSMALCKQRTWCLNALYFLLASSFLACERCCGRFCVVFGMS